MTQEFNAGEWIADGVLAALGADADTTTQELYANSRQPNPYVSRPTGYRSLPSAQSMQPAHQQPIKPTVILPQTSFTSTMGQIPHIEGPPGGPRGISQSYTDPIVRHPSRPTALTERPAEPGFASSRDKSVILISDSPGRPNVRGTSAMGVNRDTVLEAAPSKPRAMLTLTPAGAENTKAASGADPRAIASSLRRADLEKWPCRRCHFVHRGGDCEISCIGCGSRYHDKHDLICPYRNKLRQEDYSKMPVKMDSMSLNDPPPRFKPIDPRISSTMQLSLECQRRGFNPEFKYYRGMDEGDNRADLWIKDTFISGRGISYKSQKDARDALAPKGLEVVRKLGYTLDTGGFDTGRMMGGTSLRPVPNTESTSRIPSSALRPSSGSRSFSARQPEMRAGFRETEEAVMDLINSAPTGAKRLEHPRQAAAKGSVVVELPGNIDPRAAQSTVEKAVAGNPQTNISLHFPANVSLEIAQAYGLAISAMGTSSRRRSRSRSPLRDSDREYRDSDRDYRDRDYRDRERDVYHFRPSLWPPRTSTDAYRPSPHSIPRRRFENSRLRLSPRPESRYQPPYERRDRYSQDGPARR